MQIELAQQLLLDPRRDAIAKERPVRHDDSGAAGPRLAAQLTHDELEEEQGCLAGLLVFRKVGKDAALFFTAEGGIRQNNIDTIAVTDFF